MSVVTLETSENKQNGFVEAFSYFFLTKMFSMMIAYVTFISVLHMFPRMNKFLFTENNILTRLMKQESYSSVSYKVSML